MLSEVTIEQFKKAELKASNTDKPQIMDETSVEQAFENMVEKYTKMMEYYYYYTQKDLNTIENTFILGEEYTEKLNDIRNQFDNVVKFIEGDINNISAQMEKVCDNYSKNYKFTTECLEKIKVLDDYR